MAGCRGEIGTTGERGQYQRKVERTKWMIGKLSINQGCEEGYKSQVRVGLYTILDTYIISLLQAHPFILVTRP